MQTKLKKSEVGEVVRWSEFYERDRVKTSCIDGDIVTLGKTATHWKISPIIIISDYTAHPWTGRNALVSSKRQYSCRGCCVIRVRQGHKNRNII